VRKRTVRKRTVRKRTVRKRTVRVHGILRDRLACGHETLEAWEGKADGNKERTAEK